MVEKSHPNKESIKVTFIEDGFALKDLYLSMLASALKKDRKNFLAALLKSASLIKKLVDKSLYPLLSKKNAAKMWTMLENKFQHISSISMTKIFLNV